MSEQPTIRYTYTDEAPALATHSLLPVVRAFAAQAGISVELRDISLAGRIIAAFPERLTVEQRIPDHLAELGAMTLTPEANIIKLPNISASLPQLKAAIAELQAKGYDLPDHPDAPSNDDEREIRARYDRVKGSAVNPVLREGNSDRRAPRAVKEYARSHPHSMGAWEPSSTTHVATMGERDFRSNEQSTTVTADSTLRIEHVAEDGSVSVLKDAVPVLAGEVIDATFMDAAALRSFLDREIAEARSSGILLSLHMKATMMKVSDPIIFGHAVRAYFSKCSPSSATSWPQPARTRTTGSLPCSPLPRPSPLRATRPSSRRSPRPTSPGPICRWSTRIVGSPTFTCRATSSSTRRCPR
jgi:isocitrate dehydrogenase